VISHSDDHDSIQGSIGLPGPAMFNAMARLAKRAVVGGGPIYRKAGRTPIYAPADLDAWAQARIGAPQKSSSAKA